MIEPWVAAVIDEHLDYLRSQGVKALEAVEMLGIERDRPTWTEVRAAYARSYKLIMSVPAIPVIHRPGSGLPSDRIRFVSSERPKEFA